MANKHVKENYDDEKWFMGDKEYQAKKSLPYLPNIANQFRVDIESGSWNFNGVSIKHNSEMSANEGKEYRNNVLGMFNKTGAYAVMRNYQLAAFDVDTFAGEVETLLNMAERWKDIMSGASVAVEEKKSHDAELAEESHSLGGFDGFMQV